VTATFECELSKAGLKVEWTKDEKKLRRDDKFDMVSEGRTHRLVIEKAGAEDVGKYAATYEKLATSATLSVSSESTCILAELYCVCRKAFNSVIISKLAALVRMAYCAFV